MPFPSGASCGRVFCLPPGPREMGRQSLWLPWCLPRQGRERRSRDPVRAPRAGAVPTVLPPLGFPYPQGSLSGRLLLLPRCHLNAPKVLPGRHPRQPWDRHPSPSGPNRRTCARNLCCLSPLSVSSLGLEPPRAGTASSGPASPGSQSHACLRRGPGADCHIPDPKNCT